MCSVLRREDQWLDGSWAHVNCNTEFTVTPKVQPSQRHTKWVSEMSVWLKKKMDAKYSEARLWRSGTEQGAAMTMTDRDSCGPPGSRGKWEAWERRREERKLRTDGEAVVHSSRRRDVTAPIMMMFCPTLCCGTVISWCNVFCRRCTRLWSQWRITMAVWLVESQCSRFVMGNVPTLRWQRTVK